MITYKHKVVIIFNVLERNKRQYLLDCQLYRCIIDFVLYMILYSIIIYHYGITI